MKTKLSIAAAVALSLAVLLAPEKSFAGWGAIACNQNNTSCGVSYGWGTLAAAEAYAIRMCRASNRYCHIYNWEHNMCIYGPYGSYTCN